MKLFNALLSLFYPSLCVGCDEVLMQNEVFFCLDCLLHLPKTNYHCHDVGDNPAVDRFAGKIPVQQAVSYLYYSKEGLGQKIVGAIKYHGNTALGSWVGNYMAREMATSDFFADVDYIIPVPLHPKKFKKRGFNQAEIIARGISEALQIPLNTQNLYREVANTTQTKKSGFERWQNTLGIFNLHNPQQFENKCVVLFDDVLTTGATLEACGHALLQSANVRLKILTVAITAG
ncbi:phosphoribosyl transferase [Candidatus Symbiothrix dinenymphae]|nr:phosphoribosyl transferase [Candidatus Symbiothrix dinenymphae]